MTLVRRGGKLNVQTFLGPLQPGSDRRPVDMSRQDDTEVRPELLWEGSKVSDH